MRVQFCFKAQFSVLVALLLGGALQAVQVELAPDFFPGLNRHSDSEIRFRGLATLYPGKVLFEAPNLTPPSQRTEAARVEDLTRKIKYIRIYRLEEAIAAIREYAAHPSLILDFRYVKSPNTASELATLLSSKESMLSSIAIGEVPTFITEDLKELNQQHSHRPHPVVVLCNRETAGPFETILYNLQKQGSIIAVGEHSAGQTGFYQKIDPQTWVISGELRPAADVSLVATGLLPRIPVKVSAEENYSAYYLYEAGTPINRLLRQENNQQAEPDEQADEALLEHDRILQRGVDIAAALQVLS